MRLPVAAICMWMLMPCAAYSSPCQGVIEVLTDQRKGDLARALSKQLEVPSVKVLQSFGVGGWRIVYVDPPQSDSVFLFYSQDPIKARYLTLWGGAARRSETENIEKWTRKNAPGIPAPLAKCFAWYVTNGRDH